MSLMTKAADAVRDLIGNALSTLSDQEASLRRELDALREEELGLLGLPAPAQEIITNIKALIDQAAQRAAASLGPDLVAAASGVVVRAVGPPELRAPDTLAPPRLPD